MNVTKYLFITLISVNIIICMVRNMSGHIMISMVLFAGFAGLYQMIYKAVKEFNQHEKSDSTDK